MLLCHWICRLSIRFGAIYDTRLWPWSYVYQFYSINNYIFPNIITHTNVLLYREETTSMAAICLVYKYVKITCFWWHLLINVCVGLVDCLGFRKIFFTHLWTVLIASFVCPVIHWTEWPALNRAPMVAILCYF